ncbi:MAG: hypothetical protein M3296_02520 [Actinomycetota bacterium]|nr:hypothetical protein [Actinomycetota bacterium]
MVKSLWVLAPLVAGLVVLVLAGGSAVGTAVGAGSIGIAAVLAISLVFYEVGRSEDRARAAERDAADPDAGR